MAGLQYKFRLVLHKHLPLKVRNETNLTKSSNTSSKEKWLKMADFEVILKKKPKTFQTTV